MIRLSTTPSAQPHWPRRCALAGALWLVALSIGCAGTGAQGGSGPDARKKKTILLSTVYDDERLGEEAAKELEAEMGLYESPGLTAYVAELGRRLVAYAPRRPFQYKFQVLDQMAPNAFALPGGHIYVSRGLIALAESEDELAGVIGHEIIHAAERHAAAQQELARRTSPFLMPYVRMARLASYSQDHERAADRGGQEIAARAGYDPAALSKFLEHLGDSERLEIGYSRLTSYFSTHPGTTERVAATAADAVALDWTRDPLRPDGRVSHLEKIEGILLGTDPAEGIFRDSEFLHPDMDFRILFPRGWELVNTHQAVGATTPDGNGRVFLTARRATLPFEQADPDSTLEPESAGPAGTRPLTAKEAAEEFIADHGDEFDVHVVRSQPLQIGSIDAYRVDVEGRMAGTAIGGQITFIPHGGLMFRLTGVAPAAQWSQYVGRARTVARTFRPLEAEERDSVEALHLRVVEALDGEDIASLSQRRGNAWGPGRTAVLNATFVDTHFQQGDLVKIARASRYRPRSPAAVEEHADQP